MARLWGLYKDRGNWVIRRGVERLPAARYRKIREDESALRALLLRLNAPFRTKTAVEYRHAFINEALLEEYAAWLLVRVPTERSARAEYASLRRHCIDFFVGRLNLINPRDWHSVHETKWAQYLLSKEAPAASHSKKLIIQFTNRFFEWLHRKRPDELPLLVFRPLSKPMLKKAEASRPSEEVKKRTFIPDADWVKIQKALHDSVLPFALLAYHYGLRRAEALGLRLEDIRKGSLKVERQLLESGRGYGPLKGRVARQVPHWFMSAAEAYRLVEAMRPIRPDVLTHRWNRCMSKLGLNYDFHELRHTFITKAVQRHPARAVQEAAGHANIQTTMRYAHVATQLDDEVYRPTG